MCVCMCVCVSVCVGELSADDRDYLSHPAQ